MLALQSGRVVAMGFCQVLELLPVNAANVLGQEVRQRSAGGKLREQHRHDPHKHRHDQRHLAPTDELRLRVSVCKHKRQPVVHDLPWTIRTRASRKCLSKETKQKGQSR